MSEGAATLADILGPKWKRSSALDVSEQTASRNFERFEWANHVGFVHRDGETLTLRASLRAGNYEPLVPVQVVLAQGKVVETWALLDSGAHVSIVDPFVLQDAGISLDGINHDVPILGRDGYSAIGKMSGSIRLFNGHPLVEDQFYVEGSPQGPDMRAASGGVILGRDAFRNVRISFDWAREPAEFFERPPEISLTPR